MWVDLFIFFLPSLAAFELVIVGRLFLLEIVLLIVLFWFLFFRGKLLLSKLSIRFLQLAFLWLCAQIVTDIIVETPFVDYARGWAKITFFIIDFLALYLLLYSKKRLLFIYACGIVLADILNYFISPDVYAAGSPWKFGIARSVTLFVILLASKRFGKGNYGIPIVLVLFISLFNMNLGYRSLSGICFLTATYIFIVPYLRRMRGNLIPIFLLVSFIGSAFIVLAANNFIVEVSGKEELIRKKEAQTGKFGILLGGRSEIFVSTRAIKDSPIIGHGSWAKDPIYILLLKELSYYGYNININDSRLEEGLIPSHSYILGAWVESGIIGAIFWLWVLILVFRVLLNAFKTNDYLTVLTIFLAFDALWSIPFSPFGAQGRFENAYSIVLFMTLFGSLYNQTRNIYG